MSKKNNLKTRVRQHDFDLRREAAEKERLKKVAEKRERKLARQTEAGVTKKKKNKAIRIRKGVRIRGIKVVDSESKHKLLQRLKAEQAMQQMEVDEEQPAASSKKTKKKVPLIKKKSKTSSSKSGASKGTAAMETS